MDDRTSRLETALDRLESTVLSLGQRVEAIEMRLAAAPAAAADALDHAVPQAAQAAQAERKRTRDPYDPIAMLSHVGRLLLVLAGGFFLRAMTEAGHLADPVGIALAFAYAAAWLAMSDRAGARAQEPSAVFHAVAAAMVAFPLTVEATTRFKVIGGASSAFVLALLSAGLLFVAWHRGLRALVWITVLGALPTAAVLLIQTGVVVPYALVLIALGAATLWLSYASDWWGARWPVALAADAAVAAVTLRAFTPEQRDTPALAMALQGVLLLAYLGSIAWRTLARHRDVSHFEIVQTAAALMVGIGGGVVMARATGAIPAVVGIAAMLLGAACYGVALAVIRRREAESLNFYFYTTLALALVLAGVVIAFDAPAASAAFALLAVLATGLWTRSAWLFGLLHGAVYLVATGIVSGALGYGARALIVGVEGAWVVPDGLVLLALGAAVLTAALAATNEPSQNSELAIATRFVIVLLTAWAACAGVVGFVAPAAGVHSGVDAGVLATVRTGVLSVAVLVFAAMSRRAHWREWGWLVYPLLVGVGLKLLTQDFKHSRPATLFIALAFYGTALIVAPRLRRRAA